MRALLVTLSVTDPASVRAALAAALGATSVDVCQSGEAAVTWLENRPCDLVAVAGQDEAVAEAVARVRRASRTIPVLAVLPDPSSGDGGAAWLSGADDVVTTAALVAGPLPEGLDEMRHAERDVLRRTQRVWYAGPADVLRHQLGARVGARMRDVGLSGEGLVGLTTQDLETPQSSALVVNASVAPEALVLGVRRVKRTYPGLAITVVADGSHHEAFRRAGADECLGVAADGEPVLQAVGRAQSACRSALELDVVRARESRLRALLEHLPEAVMLVSPEHAVLAVNLAALRLIGAQDARQVLGSPLAPWLDEDAAHPDSAVAFVDAVTQGTPRELFARTRHLAEPRRLQLRAVPFQREAGASPAALIVLRDVADPPAVEAAPAATDVHASEFETARREWQDERAALEQQCAALEARLLATHEALAAAQSLATQSGAAHDDLASAHALALASSGALAAELADVREQLAGAFGERDRATAALADATRRVAELESSLADACARQSAVEEEPHDWFLRDVAHVGVMRTSPDGRVLEANAQAARLCGHASWQSLVESGALPEPLALLGGGESPATARFEACLQLGDAATPCWVAGARLPSRDHEGHATWLLCDVSGTRVQTDAGGGKVDPFTAVLDAVAAECTTIVNEGPALVRGPRPLESPAMSPAAVEALGRARILLAQVSAFRKRRAAHVAVDDLRARMETLDPVLRRLATDDVGWEISLPEEPLHVGAAATDLERCLTALVTSVRDALPLGGRMSLSVHTPEARHAGDRDHVRRLDAHLVLEAQGYGLTTPEPPAALHALAAGFDGRLDVEQVDSLTTRVVLHVPRAFVISHAA